MSDNAAQPAPSGATPAEAVSAASKAGRVVRANVEDVGSGVEKELQLTIKEMRAKNASSQTVLPPPEQEPQKPANTDAFHEYEEKLYRQLDAERVAEMGRAFEAAGRHERMLMWSIGGAVFIFVTAIEKSRLEILSGLGVFNFCLFAAGLFLLVAAVVFAIHSIGKSQRALQNKIASIEFRMAGKDDEDEKVQEATAMWKRDVKTVDRFNFSSRWATFLGFLCFLFFFLLFHPTVKNCIDHLL
jgi:hypothetical protein